MSDQTARIVETDWWSLQLPPEWRVEQEENCIVITDADNVSLIEISTLVEDRDFDHSQLEQLAADLVTAGGVKQLVSLNQLSGWYFEWNDAEAAYREWYLYRQRLALVVTYSCDLEHKDMDSAAVDAILQTLILSD